MSQRNRFLDVLKGLAILLIILTHYSFTDDQRALMAFPYWVDMGVPIFMIITGYVTALAYERRGITTIDEALRPVHTVRLVLRFLIPFLIAFIVELIIDFVILDWGYPGNGAMMALFFMGGNGPGAYYVPIMIQLVFLYPVLFRIVKRYGFAGVWIVGGFTVLFELCRMAYQMTDVTYCNLIFRYMPLVAYGIWLASADYKVHPVVGVIAMLVGILFIFGVSYAGYEPRIFNEWKGTSAIACLYIMPIIGLLIKKSGAWHFAPLEMLGKASFNIFLVQKIWYYVWRPVYQTDGIGDYVIAKRLLATYAVCITAGIIFYLVESRITKAVTTRVTSIISGKTAGD